MAIQTSSIRLLTVVSSLFVCSCFEDVEGPVNGDAEGTGDETEGIGPSVCWCATASGATYDPPGGGPEAETIVDSLNGGGSPKACVAVEPEINQALEDLDLNEDDFVVITNETELIPTRGEIFAATIAHCSSLADAQGMDENTTDTCDAVIVEGTTAIEQDPEYSMCTTGLGFEPPEDDWSDTYRLMDVIQVNPTNGVYEIETYFYEDVINHSYWLIADSAYIALNSNSDFAFFNVQSGDIAYALGIRTGDVPLTLNEYDVTSKLEVILAWHDLVTETEFELVVNRPTAGNVTLHYELQ